MFIIFENISLLSKLASLILLVQVILATLETDDADTDKASNCFVDTAALDGETNKKEYVCHQETCHLRNEKALSDFKCTIEAEAPNSKLYQ